MAVVKKRANWFYLISLPGSNAQHVTYGTTGGVITFQRAKAKLGWAHARQPPLLKHLFLYHLLPLVCFLFKCSFMA